MSAAGADFAEVLDLYAGTGALGIEALSRGAGHATFVESDPRAAAVLRDNLARLEETAASYHERLMMAFDIYLNKAAFEANEGIKFLTALTAVTLPAVMVGGWYGMNFEHMPELHSPHGYLWATGFTLVTTVIMVIYLKKKKWF